jgi:methionine--tRNA ligase beta chain
MHARIKPPVPYSAFDALDLRIGEIITAEPVANSSKLVRLRVSFGDHERTILSGMRKERDDLSALVGIRTLFLLNLEPKKMAGETSEGMIVDVGFADGLKPALLLPEWPVPPGTRAA